jgi:hypothetical protein
VIKIGRPEPPSAFVGNGASVKATLRLKAQAEAIFVEGDPELKKLKFGKSYWLKANKPLEAAQSFKCCYCEGPFAQTFQEVEHLRPQKGIKKSVGSEQLKPGYWWLAYDWENLLLACRACNGLKSTVFPIEDEVNRARVPTDDLIAEGMILLNPMVDFPNEHIFFDRELAKAKSLRGQITIDTVQLNREGLRKERLKALANVEREIQLFVDATTDAQRQAAFRRLKNLCGPNANYSAMSKALLESRLPELVAHF